MKICKDFIQLWKIFVSYVISQKVCLMPNIWDFLFLKYKKSLKTPFSSYIEEMKAPDGLIKEKLSLTSS